MWYLIDGLTVLSSTFGPSPGGAVGSSHAALWDHSWLNHTTFSMHLVCSSPLHRWVDLWLWRVCLADLPPLSGVSVLWHPVPHPWVRGAGNRVTLLASVVWPRGLTCFSSSKLLRHLSTPLPPLPPTLDLVKTHGLSTGVPSKCQGENGEETLPNF